MENIGSVFEAVGVAVIGILVLVRIVLSFSLDIEVEGMVPWRRAEVESKLRAAKIDPDTD